MARRFDRRAATADARVSRIEDNAVSSRQQEDVATDDAETLGVSRADRALLHVTDGDAPLSDDVTEHVVVEADDMVDALAEVFNARDLDGVVDLCAPDCEVPGLASGLEDVGAAMDDLWIRRPSVAMTRMVVDHHAVGVLWERLSRESWGTIGTVHLQLEDDQVAVMEFSDDVGLLDRRHPIPPDERDDLWVDPDEL